MAAFSWSKIARSRRSDGGNAGQRASVELEADPNAALFRAATAQTVWLCK